MARVTLLMFSGRRNPSRELTRERAAALRETLGGLFVRSAAYRYEDIGGLGYRGVLIEFAPPETELRGHHLGPLIVFGGMVQDLKNNRAANDSDSRLEDQLVDQFAADEVVFRLAKARKVRDLYKDQRCRRHPPPPVVKGLSGRRLYAPASWNGAYINDNNCYSYANDRLFTTGSGATPGSGGGDVVPSSWDDCDPVARSLRADGLEPIALDDVNEPQLEHRGWPVALYIGMQVNGVYTDYHFYRQDRSGLWSHKPGGFKVRNCDESGRSITDIRSGSFNHLDYEYCGVFETHGGVTIDQ
jgi:hypothetical protein